MRDGKWLKMGDNSIMPHPKCIGSKKNPEWNKNLSKRAKSRVRVFADIQNSAMRAHCVHGVPKIAIIALPKARCRMGIGKLDGE